MTIYNTSSELRQFCLQWFGETSRKAWDDISIKQITSDISDMNYYRSTDDLEPIEFDPQDILEEMQSIIAEYDELNKADEDDEDDE